VTHRAYTARLRVQLSSNVRLHRTCHFSSSAGAAIKSMRVYRPLASTVPPLQTGYLRIKENVGSR
ncbi:MAG: hypothetical protein ACK56I_09000, partial [bacterium]